MARMDENALDGCCSECGSLFHSTRTHPVVEVVTALVGPTTLPEFPRGYDPGEANHLIGSVPPQYLADPRFNGEGGWTSGTE